MKQYSLQGPKANNRKIQYVTSWFPESRQFPTASWCSYCQLIFFISVLCTLSHHVLFFINISQPHQQHDSVMFQPKLAYTERLVWLFVFEAKLLELFLWSKKLRMKFSFAVMYLRSRQRWLAFKPFQSIFVNQFPPHSFSWQELHNLR